MKTAIRVIATIAVGVIAAAMFAAPSSAASMVEYAHVSPNASMVEYALHVSPNASMVE